MIKKNISMERINNGSVKEFDELRLRVYSVNGEPSLPSYEIADYIRMDHEKFLDEVLKMLNQLSDEGIDQSKWVFLMHDPDIYFFTILGCGLVPVRLDNPCIKNKFISEYCYQFGISKPLTQKKKSFLS